MFLLTAILYDDTVYFDDYNSVLIRSYWTCSYKLVMQLAMYTCTSLYLLARMHRITGHSLPVYKCCENWQCRSSFNQKAIPNYRRLLGTGYFWSNCHKYNNYIAQTDAENITKKSLLKATPSTMFYHDGLI